MGYGVFVMNAMFFLVREPFGILQHDKHQLDLSRFLASNCIVQGNPITHENVLNHVLLVPHKERFVPNESP
jgi:hypothetical protein